MDLDCAIALLNAALRRRKPQRFNSAWVSRCTPRVYRFIATSVRTPLGDIDWDRITRGLDLPFQGRWHPRRRKASTPYADREQVDSVLRAHAEKRYLFLAPQDDADKRLRDTISIGLVRVAQKGNTAAERELLDLLHYLIDEWMERCPQLARWNGYREDLDAEVQRCIHGFRYAGSFIGYLFRTLLNAGRGLSKQPASLDQTHLGTVKRRIDAVVQDGETGVIMLYDPTEAHSTV